MRRITKVIALAPLTILIGFRPLGAAELDKRFLGLWSVAGVRGSCQGAVWDKKITRTHFGKHRIVEVRDEPGGSDQMMMLEHDDGDRWGYSIGFSAQSKEWLYLAPMDENWVKHTDTRRDVFRRCPPVKVHSRSDERGLKPGQVFRECDMCPEMVVVSAGSFVMGSPVGESNRDSDEDPQHKIIFSEPFAVGKYEVTFAEWDACAAAGRCTKSGPDDSGWGRGRRPVINATWHDAKTYVKWLADKTGKGYRLLTEAEWEYSARAGTSTAYSFGDTISTQQARYFSPLSLDSNKTAPVGSFPPNKFGIHDMHGNVFEWTEDCWHNDYRGAPADGSAWTSERCKRRVVRGGAWHLESRRLRSAYRDWSPPHETELGQGFRVARTLGARP